VVGGVQARRFHTDLNPCSPDHPGYRYERQCSRGTRRAGDVRAHRGRVTCRRRASGVLSEHVGTRAGAPRCSSSSTTCTGWTVPPARSSGSSAGGSGEAASGCSGRPGLEPADSSNAPACRSSTSPRFWSPTRWSCWATSSPTFRPASGATSPTKRKATRLRCWSSPPRSDGFMTWSPAVLVLTVTVGAAGAVDAEQVDRERAGLLERPPHRLIPGQYSLRDEGGGCGGWGLALEELPQSRSPHVHGRVPRLVAAITRHRSVLAAIRVVPSSTSRQPAGSSRARGRRR
jgi:hypothetical protein